VSIALEIRGVAKRYVAGFGGCLASVDALRSVDLSVCPGDVIAVVGPPGAGKSTLLLAAAGLLVPDRGEIRWYGEAHRAAAARHAVYHFAGVRATPAERTPARVHLVDDVDALGAAEGARFARWIARRSRAAESVVIATRNRATALALAPRVFVLTGGVLHADVVAPAPRVAEVARSASSFLRTMGPDARHGVIAPGAGD
jgi:ABC-type nitrate/sulfonate/bicarbonate transport system ATPase subunit